jgi:hypothetical protein
VWAIEEGLERSLQLPWPMLNSIVKKRLHAGQAEPPGTSVWTKSKFFFTQG